MLEFMKYGPAPCPEEKDAPMCVVTSPERCGRSAVGEVWNLPFCEVHGTEAHAAARLEAVADAEREVYALLANMGGQRIARNPLVRDALAGLSFSGDDLDKRHSEAIRTAYPLDYAAEEAYTDPDILRFDYADATERDTPYDWWCEAREMVVGWMREAYEAGQPTLLRTLEAVREHATVQQELALRDMERRWVGVRPAG